MEYEVSSAAVPGSGMEQESQRVITKKWQPVVHQATLASSVWNYMDMFWKNH